MRTERTLHACRRSECPATFYTIVNSLTGTTSGRARAAPGSWVGIRSFDRTTALGAVFADKLPRGGLSDVDLRGEIGSNNLGPATFLKKDLNVIRHLFVTKFYFIRN